jgi:hypothetical protein
MMLPAGDLVTTADKYLDITPSSDINNQLDATITIY